MKFTDEEYARALEANETHELEQRVEELEAECEDLREELESLRSEGVKPDVCN